MAYLKASSVLIAVLALGVWGAPSQAEPVKLLSGEKALLDFRPPSSAPWAKSAWRLVRVEPERIAGPTAVVLLHGSGTDRWADFIAWAATSPEAADLRAAFQLWDFQQPMSGVDAPIGFSSDYPAFSESIVAYLDRFLTEAAQSGVESGGSLHHFPQGPFAILAHSQGGLKARAFLANFPAHAAQVFAVVSLDAPLQGTPWATPEWLRHTVGRLGASIPKPAELLAERMLCDVPLNGYISLHRQSDLDMGWANADNGLPTVSFPVWDYLRGPVTRVLSPRDANFTQARTLPGYDDRTFEPRRQLATYCGGMDDLDAKTTPEIFGKFFLYGGYLDPQEDAWALLARVASSTADSRELENAGLSLFSVLMGAVATREGDVFAGAYLANDGFVPLQSQLMLDGSETERIYETDLINGQRVPRRPLRVREDYVRAHTRGHPERVRILRGWSHLDTVTGRYAPFTGHSELFVSVATDLLGARPVS